MLLAIWKLFLDMSSTFVAVNCVLKHSCVLKLTYWWVKSLCMKYFMSCTNLGFPFSYLSVYDEWNSLVKDVAEGNEILGEDREAPHWTEWGFFWLVHPW